MSRATDSDHREPVPTALWDNAAPDVRASGQRFQMQSYQTDPDAWIPMENGAAASVWRPRATVIDAVAKCLAWTGFLGIPAMQVVDLMTDDVVWRLSDRYPQAGESITLRTADERRAHELARAVFTEKGARPAHDARGTGEQTSLFPALE